MNENTIDPGRWNAVLTRDASREGEFVYAVTSTGIYCRPTCPSRRPRPDRVRFFDAPPDAERAGFRACRRCSPKGVAPETDRREAVREACAILEAAEDAVPLVELAARVGLSRFHFHRLFREVTGVTPRAFASQIKARRLRSALHRGVGVTEAIFEAGYGSTSRVYERAQDALGMTPSTFRGGGRGQLIQFAVAPTSFGWVAVASTERGVCAVELGDDAASLRLRMPLLFPDAKLEEAPAEMQSTVAAVVGALRVPDRSHTLPLDVQGTAFQKRVWEALRGIRPGETRTYGQLARQLGTPRGARAVAQACAANRLAVLVPCHRVVRGDATGGGYRWGVQRKEALLAQERGDPTLRTVNP